MHIFFIIILWSSAFQQVLTLQRKDAYRNPVTPHVLQLSRSPPRDPLKPSANYLTKRFNPTALPNVTRVKTQNDDLLVANVQHELLTLGGRVYMTEITLAGDPYTLVIDTGSSDTWIAGTSFQCQARFTKTVLHQDACGFGKLYDPSTSSTIEDISTHDFSVRYTDGEFLSGSLATEELGIGGLETRQTIGVVESGFWIGDGISSGLIGLAYPVLASNVKDLNYTSIIFSLFADGTVPPVFSLALSRPSVEDPLAGGVLAIGGIPDTAVNDSIGFVSVPVQPILSSTYAFYSIPVDGFTIVAPPATRSRTGVPNRPTRKNFANASAKLVGKTVEMVVDSGTTLIYLPDAIADYIASQFSPPAEHVSLTNLYVVDCNAQAPKLGVNIGGKTFWIDERDLIPGQQANGVRDGDEETPMGGIDTSENGGGSCVLAIQRQGSGDAVLGDSFLKNVVVVFDLGANEVRVAAREKY